MAAALAQRVAADEHPRPGDQAAADRLLHAPISAPGVPDGGESLAQRLADHRPGCVGQQAGRIGPALRGQVHLNRADVDVGGCTWLVAVGCGPTPRPPKHWAAAPDRQPSCGPCPGPRRTRTDQAADDRRLSVTGPRGRAQNGPEPAPQYGHGSTGPGAARAATAGSSPRDRREVGRRGEAGITAGPVRGPGQSALPGSSLKRGRHLAADRVPDAVPPRPAPRLGDGRTHPRAPLGLRPVRPGADTMAAPHPPGHEGAVVDDVPHPAPRCGRHPVTGRARLTCVSTRGHAPSAFSGTARRSSCGSASRLSELIGR